MRTHDDGVDSKMSGLGVGDCEEHGMNVTIRLNLLGWQFATFNVDLDLEQFGEDAPTRHAFDDACKRISRRWMKARTS